MNEGVYYWFNWEHSNMTRNNYRSPWYGKTVRLSEKGRRIGKTVNRFIHERGLDPNADWDEETKEALDKQITVEEIMFVLKKDGVI